MSDAQIPTIVLGGTGYVAGELLRLIAGHPQLRARRQSCRTASPASPSAKAFPHLASVYPDDEVQVAWRKSSS